MGAASRAPRETPGERAELGAGAWGSGETVEEGAVQWLAGAPRTEKETSNIQTISARTPAPRAHTHTDTHSYLQAVIALISLKIMGSICNNLGRKKNATLGVKDRREGERLAGSYQACPLWKALESVGFGRRSWFGRLRESL